MSNMKLLVVGRNILKRLKMYDRQKLRAKFNFFLVTHEYDSYSEEESWIVVVQESGLEWEFPNLKEMNEWIEKL